MVWFKVVSWYSENCKPRKSFSQHKLVLDYTTIPNLLYLCSKSPKFLLALYTVLFKIKKCCN